MDDSTPSNPSFFARFGTAWVCFWRVLGSPAVCRRVALALPEPAPKPPPPPQSKPAALPPERVHASGLYALAMLQREGRLIDFLQEDVAAFSDADVGAAARVVHAGCRKALDQALTLEPVLKQSEGDQVTVPAGFDAQRIRLTGGVTGQPPFRGSLKHHGWVATSINFPSVSESMDPRVIATAEVEIA